MKTALLSLIAAAFGATAALADDAPPTVTFETLAKSVPNDDKPATYPQELTKLEGKTVRVSGFVSPYDDPEKMMKMLFTKAAIGCFYCNPPKENEVVFVRRAASEKPLKSDTELVTVEGTLHLVHADTKDDEAKGFLFTIDEAKVVTK